MTSTEFRAPRTPRWRHRRIEASDLRAAIFGDYDDAMTVHRQAHRTTSDDSDELVLVEAHDEWWVTRRVSDSVVVWAYGGEFQADLGFDGQLQEVSPRGVWIESEP
jgi:hypothetical protein